MTRLQVFDYYWSQKHPRGGVLIELEGKTKDLLCSLPIEYMGDEADLDLIPEFQGTTMRVRITVELIPEHGG